MGPQYEGLLILGGRMVTNLDVGSSQKAPYPETKEYTLHYVKGMLGDTGRSGYVVGLHYVHLSKLRGSTSTQKLSHVVLRA